MTVTKCSARIPARDSARITSRRKTGWTLLLAIALLQLPTRGFADPIVKSAESPTPTPQNHIRGREEKEKSESTTADAIINVDANTLSNSKLDTSTTKSYDFFSKSVEIGSKANVVVTNIDINKVIKHDNEVKRLGGDGDEPSTNNSVDKENRSAKREPILYRDPFVESSNKSTNPDKNKSIPSKKFGHTFAVIADGDVKILQTDDGKALVIMSEDDDGYLDKYGTTQKNITESLDDDVNVTRSTVPVEIYNYEDEELMKYQGDMPFERLPRLEIFTNEVLSELNVKQVLECKLPSNATFSHWTKDGQKIALVLDGPRVRSRLLLTKSGHAVISRVVKEDDGSWVCHGLDKDGRSYDAESIKLIVLEMPYKATLTIAGNVVKGEGEVITVTEKTDLMPTCIIKGGRPRPKLSWIVRRLNTSPEFGDQKVYQEVENLDVTLKENGADLISVLKLEASKIHHNSTITCVTHHPSLTRSMHSSIRLYINHEPSFSFTREPGFGYPIWAGERVTLKCEVDGYPPSEPKWMMFENDEPLIAQTEPGFLDFSPLKRNDTGWYKCVTESQFGKFTSIGIYLSVRFSEPETTIEPDDDEKPASGTVEVALGGVVQLQCPTGSIGCWGRRSDDGIWNGAGSTAPHGALSISGLLYQEAGEYRCEGLSPSTHGHLKVLREATIVVTGGPTVFPTNRTVLVSEGQSATFSAEYCANPAPTRVIWISSERLIRLGEHSGQIVAHNATNASAPGCSVAQLTIKPAGLQHNGEFSLLVRNAHGSKEAVFQLAVTATRKVSKTDSILNDWLGINSSIVKKPSYNYILCALLILCFKNYVRSEH